MYNDRQQQQSVTIQVSAIEGIQMPQAPMPAQAPMAQAAPQMPQEDTGAEAGEDASPQAKTAFVAALEAVRQYHMAKDPAEKEKWKAAADKLHKIVLNDGPQMLSCKVEYTALMALGDPSNDPANGIGGRKPGAPGKGPKVSVPPVRPVATTQANTQPTKAEVKSAPEPIQPPKVPNTSAPVPKVPGNSQEQSKVIDRSPSLGGWPETQDPENNNITPEQASSQQGTNAGQLKQPASESVNAGNLNIGKPGITAEAQAEHDANVTMALSGAAKDGKTDKNLLGNILNSSKSKPLSQVGVNKAAEALQIPSKPAINLAYEFRKREGMQSPKAPSTPPVPDRVSQQAKTVTQSPQDIRDIEEVRKAEAEGRKHQFDLTDEEKALGNASHPDVAESQSKRFQKAYQALEAAKDSEKASNDFNEELNASPKKPVSPPSENPQAKNSAAEVQGEDKNKPESRDERKQKYHDAFDKGTKPQSANGVGTAQTAVDVLHHLVKGARSFVNGNFGDAAGHVGNAAATREGFRNDQKILEGRKAEAEGEKKRWDRVIDRASGLELDDKGKKVNLTTEEAVAARRAFKKYDLEVKKHLADAMGIPNAKELTSDELNVAVDNYFNEKSPESRDKAELHDQMLQQNQKFVDRMDSDGTLTAAEARGFKNDLHNLTHDELKSLAESQGFSPYGSRKLLINQLKSKIDSHEEGRKAREKEKEGSKELLDEQVDNLKLAYNPRTGEYEPEAPITDKAVATGMANTFSKLSNEDKIAILKRMVEDPDEIDQIKGTGLNARFREELDKHTLAKKTRGQELQGEDNLDVADKIKGKIADPEADGLTQEDYKSFVQSLPKDEKELRDIGVAMGIEGAGDLPIVRLRVRIKDMAAMAIQRDEEDSPLDNGVNEDAGDVDAIADHLASDPESVLTKTNAAILKKAIPSGDAAALRDMSEKMGLPTVNHLTGKPYGPLALEENIKAEIANRTEKPAKAVPAKAPPKPKDEGDDEGGGGTPKTPPTPPPAPPAAPATEAKVPDVELPIGEPQKAAPEIPKPPSGSSSKAPENTKKPIAPKRASRAKPEVNPVPEKAGKPELADDEETKKVPEEPKPAKVGEYDPKTARNTTIREIAGSLGLTGDKKGFIASSKMPEVIKAYFDHKIPDGPDKKVQEERKKAWDMVSNQPAVLDRVFTEGAQPEDVEEFLDDIALNMVAGKKNVLEGTKAESNKARQDEAKTEGMKAKLDLAADVAEKAKTLPAYADVDPADHKAITSLDSISKRMADLGSLISDISKRAKNKQEKLKPSKQELEDLAKVEKRYNALRALHAQLRGEADTNSAVEVKPKPKSDDDEGGSAVPKTPTPPKPKTPPAGKPKSESESEKVNQGVARIEAARRQVEEEGHDPKELDFVAKETRKIGNEDVARFNAMLREAKDGLGQSQKNTRFKSHRDKKGDWTSIPGFDIMVQEISQNPRYSHYFKTENAESGSHEDQMYEYLVSGPRKEMTVAEATEAAAKEIINRGKKGDTGSSSPTDEEVEGALAGNDDESWRDKPVEGEGSFDFGANDDGPGDHYAIASKLKTGGAVTPEEASSLRDAYSKMSDGDKLVLAKALGLRNAGSALESTRDELVDRKIREGEFQHSQEAKGIEPELEEGGGLFGEPGIGKSAGLFDDAKGPPKKTESEEVSDRLKAKAAEAPKPKATKEPEAKPKPEVKKEGQFSFEKTPYAEDGESIKTDGGRIHINSKPGKFSPRSQSVVDFVVDEDKRGQGIGDKLLKEAMKRHKDLGGQVSSLASLKVFYNNGFRNPDMPEADFETHAKEFKDSGGSLYMAQNNDSGKPYVKPASPAKKEEPRVNDRANDGIDDALITEVKAAQGRRRDADYMPKKEAAALGKKLEPLDEEQLKKFLKAHGMAPIGQEKMSKAEIIDRLINGWSGDFD